jgi:hypothetical protein
MRDEKRNITQTPQSIQKKAVNVALRSPILRVLSVLGVR